MKRKVIKIDEHKCVGCGLCVSACREGAIGMVDGKAKLLRDDHCDGLGNCLPACPVNAITLEEREAAEFNKTNIKKSDSKKQDALPCGCPSTHSKSFDREKYDRNEHASSMTLSTSSLKQWPVQIKLVPVNAPYFDNANLLISADCSAYAYGNFHNEYMKNRITIIGCPKLDEGDYSEKLTAIISSNSIKSVTVVRMEVPCCSGIENAAKTALKNSGKFIPWRIVIFSTDGEVLSD